MNEHKNCETEEYHIEEWDDILHLFVMTDGGTVPVKIKYCPTCGKEIFSQSGTRKGKES